VPIAAGSVAWDGSQFVTNQVLIPVFADPSQAETIVDDYGYQIPNPAMMDGSEAAGMPH
jgi:hypothetical protein